MYTESRDLRSAMWVIRLATGVAGHWFSLVDNGMTIGPRTTVKAAS